MEKETRTVDSGYTKAGVYWSIEQYKLRYATVFEVRVNGKATQFRSRKDCYNHLQTTGVQSFRQVQVEGKQSYQAVMEGNDDRNDSDDNDNNGSANSES